MLRRRNNSFLHEGQVAGTCLAVHPQQYKGRPPPYSAFPHSAGRHAKIDTNKCFEQRYSTAIIRLFSYKGF